MKAEELMEDSLQHLNKAFKGQPKPDTITRIRAILGHKGPQEYFTMEELVER